MALPILGFIAERAGTTAVASALGAVAPVAAPFVSPIAAAATACYVVKKGCELLKGYDNFDVSISHGDTNISVKARR